MTEPDANTDPLADLMQLIVTLAAALDPGDGSDTAASGRRKAVTESLVADQWLDALLAEAQSHGDPMYAPGGNGARPDRVARLAAALGAALRDNAARVANAVTSAAVFRLLDAQYGRSGKPDTADVRHNAYASTIRFIATYADTTAQPSERPALAALVDVLRNHYGVPVVTHPDAPNVRHAGLRCRVCQTEIAYDRAAADPDRCPDHQPQGAQT